MCENQTFLGLRIKYPRKTYCYCVL